MWILVIMVLVRLFSLVLHSWNRVCRAVVFFDCADYSSNCYNADVNCCEDSSGYANPPGSVVCLFLLSLCFKFCIPRRVLIKKFDIVFRLCILVKGKQLDKQSPFKVFNTCNYQNFTTLYAADADCIHQWLWKEFQKLAVSN